MYQLTTHLHSNFFPWRKSLISPKRLLGLALLIGLWLPTKAQVNWPYLIPSNNPVYYNPAFAGSLENGRLSLTLAAESLTSTLADEHLGSGTFSWDQRISKLKGGIGVITEFSQHNLHNNGRLGLMWSPKLKLGSGATLAPGLGADFGWVHGVRDSLIFAGVTDPLIIDGDTHVFYPNLNAGFMFNTPKFYLGVAVNHVNRPSPAIIPGARYPGPFQRKLVLQSGYTFKPNESASWSASVQGIALFAERNLYQALGSFRYKTLIFGVGVHGRSYLARALADFNVSHLILNLAYKTPWFKISYAQAPDINIDSPFRTTLREFSFVWYLGSLRSGDN